ncbi:TadE/TadG family type IV pilus assembly protein, partial [Streptomyces sp. 2MCAF27]
GGGVAGVADGGTGTGPESLREVPSTPSRRFQRKRGGDRGQVAVEFLGVLPLVLVVLAVIWQFVLLGYTYSLAGNSADKAARAGAAVGGDAGACQQAALKDLPSAWQESAEITCGQGADGVWKATVKVHVPVLFPGAADFPWPVTGTAGAVDEQAEGV